MVGIVKPRYIQNRPLKEGMTWYWTPPTKLKKRAIAEKKEFPFVCVKLGVDLSQRELNKAAAAHNQIFDEWKRGDVQKFSAYGSVAWMLDRYQKEEVFLRRVAERSRPDYRLIYNQVCDIPTKDSKTFGALPVSSVSPAAATKIYQRMVDGDKFRRGEKALMYLSTAWRRMQPLYPREFRMDVPDPWAGVPLYKRKKLTKPAATREEVYIFAAAALVASRPEAAAAAVICFEWLQRPENAIGGHISWTDYRGKDHPDKIRIVHHKTGETIMHPLDDVHSDGSVLRLYPEAELVLSKLPRRGLRLILGPDNQTYQPTRFAQIIRKIADAAGLPKSFTLDACRHGGMTELEEAELTDGQGRALSAHKSRAYDGYAKRTEVRLLIATKRRREHIVGKDKAANS